MELIFFPQWLTSFISRTFLPILGENFLWALHVTLLPCFPPSIFRFTSHAISTFKEAALGSFFFLFKCVILNVMPLVWSRTIESGSVT